ncbi:hypothetical protein BHE74_00050645, partial [Ensete ventricosum]
NKHVKETHHACCHVGYKIGNCKICVDEARTSFRSGASFLRGIRCTAVLVALSNWFLAGRVLDLRPLPCILSIVLIPRHRMRKQGGFPKKLGSEPAFDREARLG